MIRVIFILLACAFSASATVIESSNRIAWVKDSTVGVRGGITNFGTVVNVGVTNASGIEAQIAAASYGTVLQLTNGVYDITSGLDLNKSGIVVRGVGSNTVLVGHINWGTDSTGDTTFSITNGGFKGDTNFVLSSKTAQWGDALVAGDLIYISGTFSETNSNFPVISTTGYKSILGQCAEIESVNGLTVNITAPLVFNFTNSGTVVGLNDAQLTVISFTGLESLRVTTTNSGLSDASVYMINAICVRDSWVTNCWMEYGNNYLLGLSKSVHWEVCGNVIGPSPGVGTSHTGFILENVGATLVQNNIVHSNAQGGLMFNGGVSGCAFFGNFFTNNGGNGDVLMHNTHPVMNLWEANIFPVKFMLDGYFGSSSHQTLFRCLHSGSLAFKRWSTYNNVVGCVIGDDSYNYLYLNGTNGFTQYPVFDFGFPNIGNTTYRLVSPPERFDFPGTNFSGFEGEEVTNGYTFITQSTELTNTIWGNFTNFPQSAAPQNYPIKFAAVTGDTNRYFPSDGLQLIPTTAGGTTTNMVMNRAVWVTNGWRVLRAGPVAYQAYQPSNYWTHTLHGNLLVTNLTPALVWDPNNADHSLSNSLLYPVKPAWWGENHWPAVDPETSPYVWAIPAEDRYNGVAAGGGTTAAIVTGGTVILNGYNKLQ